MLKDKIAQSRAYLKDSPFEELAASLAGPCAVECRELELVIGVATGLRRNVVHGVLQGFDPHLLLLLGARVQRVGLVGLVVDEQPLVRPAGVPAERLSRRVILHAVLVQSYGLSVTVL